MSKKQSEIKRGKEDIPLSREESDELQMILDRLAVQDPEGESFHSYLQSLRKALSGRPLTAAALIDRLSRAPSLTGFRTFQSLEKIAENSPYKKHLKLAAYRFSQKGFTAAEKAPSQEKVVLIRNEQRKAIAHLFLTQGTLWVVSGLIPEAAMGGYVLATAFLEDDFATFNVRVADSSSQKLYREYLQVLSTHAFSGRGIEIPLRHAALLFFEMLDFWTEKKSYPHLERGRDLFKRYYEPGGKPYVYELMPEIEDAEELLPEIEEEELFSSMDLSWLQFSKEELAPYHEKLNEMHSPLIVVPPHIQEERGLELLSSAAESLCVGTKRRLFRRFFEEQAMAFKLAGSEDKAHWAWTIACSLKDHLSAAANPIVRLMLLKSLDSYWPSDSKDIREKDKPVKERRTESGIILL